MKNDLISRSALLGCIGNLDDNPEDDTNFVTMRQACVAAHQCIVKMVLLAPAVDAVEVGSCEGCYWKAIGRYHRCSCCRRNRDMKDCYRRADDGKC